MSTPSRRDSVTSEDYGFGGLLTPTTSASSLKLGADSGSAQDSAISSSTERSTSTPLSRAGEDLEKHLSEEFGFGGFLSRRNSLEDEGFGFGNFDEDERQENPIVAEPVMLEAERSGSGLTSPQSTGWQNDRRKSSIKADDSWLSRGQSPTTAWSPAQQQPENRALSPREIGGELPRGQATSTPRRKISRDRPGSMQASVVGVSYSSRAPTATTDYPLQTPLTRPVSRNAPTADFRLLQSTMLNIRSSTTIPAKTSSASQNYSRSEVSPITNAVDGKTNSGMFKNGITQTVEEIEADNSDASVYEIIEPRAIEAARWTNKSIADLIEEIQKHGAQNSVKFGVLFQATANKFDALAGLLKTAKKYKVVAYEGEQLWQRVHDDVEITLLKNSFEGIKIRRRLKSAVKHGAGNSGGSKAWGHEFRPGERCAAATCNRIVYQNECVAAGGKQYCRACFRCTTCSKVLKQSDYSVSRDMNHRCNKCHREFEIGQFH